MFPCTEAQSREGNPASCKDLITCATNCCLPGSALEGTQNQELERRMETRQDQMPPSIVKSLMHIYWHKKTCLLKKGIKHPFAQSWCLSVWDEGQLQQHLATSLLTPLPAVLCWQIFEFSWRTDF